MTSVNSLERLLAMCHADAKVIAWSEYGWHSATFSGSRAIATLYFPGDAAVFGEALLDCIARDEFALEGSDVVEATVGWVNQQIGHTRPGLTFQIRLLLLDKEPTVDLSA